MKYDYIIVGQGIAGSLLAWTLIQHNKKILVIDDWQPNSSSNIAAGIINPITGRKMVKSWMIDEVFPFAKKTYKSIEEILGTNFFFEKNIYKVFTSDLDIAIWNKKKEENEYENYLGDIITINNKEINAPFQIGIIKQAAWMDVPLFIKHFRQYLQSINSLFEHKFNYEKLAISKTVSYIDFEADNIIFCEGFKAINNPYFINIPFTLAKGEQILIHSTTLKSDKLWNKNIFIIPKNNDNYSVGSTFIWNDLTETVTQNGIAELKEKINKLITVPFEIIEQKAAIRPTMKDRRPILGNHFKYKNLWIFNGLGTKGVSLVPYFSNYLFHCIENKLEIMKEVSFNRFYQ